MDPDFKTAVDEAIEAFFDEMAQHGWHKVSPNYGTTKLTDNTKNGRKGFKGGGRVYGHHIELRELFFKPEAH
jgi:hypothetical protein